MELGQFSVEVEHIQISDTALPQGLLQSYGQVSGAGERGDGLVDKQKTIASETRSRQT